MNTSNSLLKKASVVPLVVRGVLYCAFFFLFPLFVSCIDEVRYSSDPRQHLSFSADTIAFDTLFTDVGSITGALQVYNPGDAHLLLSDVRLAGGWESPFRVNVDGQYGVQFTDVELRAGDSLYVFVEVTVPPTDADAPVEVCDSIVFTLSSGTQGRVVLTAAGWNTIPLHGVVLDADTAFAARRPYFVYDSLVVTRGTTLTLAPGTRLFFHDKAYLRVDGTLHALGTADSAVLFRGDRLDNMFSYLPYDRIPSQWGGIVFGPASKDNILLNCNVHSATFGLRFEIAFIQRQNQVFGVADRVRAVRQVDRLKLIACGQRS